MVGLCQAWCNCAKHGRTVPRIEQTVPRRSVAMLRAMEMCGTHETLRFTPDGRKAESLKSTISKVWSLTYRLMHLMVCLFFYFITTWQPTPWLPKITISASIDRPTMRLVHIMG
jgi:hypothetical protein